MSTIKAILKNILKRKDGNCKVVIRLNHKGQEASIKNEWYAIEPYTRKKENLNAVWNTHYIYGIAVL